MEIKPQVVLSMKEYEYLLSSQKQNMATKNTWEKYYNDQLDIARKNFDDKVKEIEEEHQAHMIETIKMAIENKTHALVFFSTVKSEMEVCPNNDPQAAGKLVPNSIWKFVPIENIDKGVKLWRKLIRKR